MKNFKPYIMVLFSLWGFNSTSQENFNGDLTDEEKNMLKVLREEEKLARDVYLYAYEKYGLPIFSNIGNSEQRHMDQVLFLLEQYGLEDPALPKEGEFVNEELQSLYDQLTSKVDLSLMDALEVGATIEDLDIKDILEFIEDTDKAPIIDTFQRLECGSRNHMRAFISQITSRGGNYKPQFISPEMFRHIINSSHERCGRL